MCVSRVFIGLHRAFMALEVFCILKQLPAQAAALIQFAVCSPLMHKKMLLGVKESAALQASMSCDVCNRKRNRQVRRCDTQSGP